MRWAAAVHREECAGIRTSRLRMAGWLAGWLDTPDESSNLEE